MAAARDVSTDQLAGLPLWARVGAQLTTISIVSGLLVYLVTHMVQNQERLIDKFDKVIERHDDRQREWMRSHGDKIVQENEKTRVVLTTTNEKTLRAIDDMTQRQEKSHMDISRALETQTLVLKQILAKDKMP